MWPERMSGHFFLQAIQRWSVVFNTAGMLFKRSFLMKKVIKNLQ